MAVDQAILESVDESGLPVLRIYGWQPATLSLGYFQAYEDRQTHVESTSCDVVRRASGGGAILHDNEITYSLTFPSANRWAAKNAEVYDLVHKSISAVLLEHDVKTYAFDPDQHPAPEDPRSFLCFQRRHAGDLICEGYKVVGSAQRRSKKAVLQHGSILLGQSLYAPQLPGLEQLAQKELDADELTVQIVREITETIGLLAIKSTLADIEENRAEAYLNRKFLHKDWTISRKKIEVSI